MSQPCNFKAYQLPLRPKEEEVGQGTDLFCQLILDKPQRMTIYSSKSVFVCVFVFDVAYNSIGSI